MDGGEDGISKERIDNKLGPSFLSSCKLENPLGPLEMRNKLQEKSWGNGELKITRN